VRTGADEKPASPCDTLRYDVVGVIVPLHSARFRRKIRTIQGGPQKMAQTLRRTKKPVPFFGPLCICFVLSRGQFSPNDVFTSINQVSIFHSTMILTLVSPYTPTSFLSMEGCCFCLFPRESHFLQIIPDCATPVDLLLSLTQHLSDYHPHRHHHHHHHHVL